MLPSLMVVTGLAGFLMSASSSIISATRLPLAALCVSMTNTIDSIISDMRMDMT